MAKTGALFSEGAAGRISRVVRKVEGQAGGESGKRPRRLAGIATFLWAKLTSDFSSGAANTVKANPCSNGDGDDVVTDVDVVLYVEIPTSGTPDRSCFSANDVVVYMPYTFRDAEGNETAQGFLVDPTRAGGLPTGTGYAQILYWDPDAGEFKLSAVPADPLTKNYEYVWDKDTKKVKAVEIGPFVCDPP